MRWSSRASSRWRCCLDCATKPLILSSSMRKEPKTASPSFLCTVDLTSHSHRSSARLAREELTGALRRFRHADRSSGWGHSIGDRQKGTAGEYPRHLHLRQRMFTGCQNRCIRDAWAFCQWPVPRLQSRYLGRWASCPFSCSLAGVVSQGTTSHQPICHVDLMATLADLMGRKLPTILVWTAFLFCLL